MSELSITPSEIVPADLDDAFDDWLAGATISKRSVLIYGKPGLYADFQALEREYELAKSQAEDGVELAGSPLKEIERRMKDVYDEWVASKSTWTVRALRDDEVDALDAQEPTLIPPTPPKAPEAPKPLPAKHSEQDAKSFTIAAKKYQDEKAEYDVAFAEHQKRMNAYTLEHSMRAIAAATERIEFANGRVTNDVTVEQIRRLHHSLGERQILSLATAASLAAMQEPEIPAPFFKSRSESDQTS